MSGPIVFRDRDRDKSYLAEYVEVIREVRVQTSDGNTVTINMANLGQIHVMPAQSENEMFIVMEERVVFSPCSPTV